MFAVRSGCRRPRRPASSACLSLPRPDVSPPACRIPFRHTPDTDPQPAHCTPMQCFLCDPRCRLDSEWLPPSFPTAHAQNVQYFNITSALNCDGVEMCRRSLLCCRPVSIPTKDPRTLPTYHDVEVCIIAKFLFQKTPQHPLIDPPHRHVNIIPRRLLFRACLRRRVRILIGFLTSPCRKRPPPRRNFLRQLPCTPLKVIHVRLPLTPSPSPTSTMSPLPRVLPQTQRHSVSRNSHSIVRILNSKDKPLSFKM
ncbi:hypothetical protein QBC34DRAFT_413040 [Podospora aff. communis PSN243]|uniref:Uncharacterized protein n=1 Tax=Podospora aff. communis PSN243 TaxID=3040156 RepID=A0AAV9GCE1_9PEZI|nr:hypothetical protein QBC34DRAFT_413040 [Podospora aff. communis PSN243]